MRLAGSGTGRPKTGHLEPLFILAEALLKATASLRSGRAHGSRR